MLVVKHTKNIIFSSIHSNEWVGLKNLHNFNDQIMKVYLVDCSNTRVSKNLLINKRMILRFSIFVINEIKLKIFSNDSNIDSTTSNYLSLASGWVQLQLCFLPFYPSTFSTFFSATPATASVMLKQE